MLLRMWTIVWMVCFKGQAVLDSYFNRIPKYVATWYRSIQVWRWLLLVGPRILSAPSVTAAVPPPAAHLSPYHLREKTQKLWNLQLEHKWKSQEHQPSFPISLLMQMFSLCVCVGGLHQHNINANTMQTSTTKHIWKSVNKTKNICCKRHILWWMYFYWYFNNQLIMSVSLDEMCSSYNRFLFIFC